MEKSLRTGPFALLEDALAGTVSRLRERDRLASIYVLVPTHILGRHLMRAIARRQGVCFNVRFHTFPDLAEIVGIEALVRTGRIPQPRLADFLLARRAVHHAIPDDGYLAPIRDLPSTPRVVLRTLEDLKRARLAADQIEHLASREESGSAAGMPYVCKWREVAAVYRTFERLQFEAGYFDESERLALAADAVRTSPLLDAALAVCLYGFAELNHVEERFFEACVQGRAAYAFVPADVGRHTRPLLDWLRGQGFAPVGEASDNGTREGPRALAGRLFAESVPAAGTEPVRADVEILSAPGVAAEMEEIARRLLRFAERGGRLHDAAVLLRHPEAYERTLRDVFDAAGIPYVVLDGVPASEHLAGRLLRLLVHIRLGGFLRPDVMEFLGLAPLRPALLRDCPEASSADWDRMSREAGVVRGRDQWRRVSAMRGRLQWRVRRLREEAVEAGDGDGSLIAQLEREFRSLQAFERVLRILRARLEAIPERGPLNVLMGRLLRALVALTVLSPEERGVVGILADLVRGPQGAEEMDLEVFAALVEDLLKERVPPTGVYHAGNVVVASLSAAAGLPFRLVLIPGLVERSFPPPARQDPVLLDPERAALNRAFGARLRLAEAQAADEQFAFRHAVGAAGEAVVLTYPRLDAATGQLRVASHYLLRVVEALAGRPADYETLGRHERRISVGRLDPGETLLTPAEWDLRLAVRARAAGDLGPLASLPGFPAVRRGALVEEARWRCRTLTEHDGILGRAVPLPATFSATQLETYATCPFRFFGERILGAREIEEPEELEAISPLDRGALIHDILERFFRDLAADGLLPLRRERRTEYLDRMRETARRAFQAFEREGAVGYAFMWSVEQARLLTDLETFLEQELADPTEFAPTFFEARFGPTPWGTPQPGSTPDPVELHAGRRVLRLTGYIDRIDVGPRNRARVIDYKSGKVTGVKDDQLRGGTTLQLPLYILAADAILRHHGIGAETAEAQYYYVTGRGGFRRVRFTRAALAARRRDLEMVLTTTVDGIAAGLFPQRPGKGGEHCRFCAFKPVCGQGRVTLAGRKQEDPASARLRAMWEVE